MSRLRRRSLGSLNRRKARHDDQTGNLTVIVCPEEPLVVADRDATVGVAVRSEHVTMREQTGAAKRRGAINGKHAKRADSMEELFARLQLVGRRRRCTDHALVHMIRVVPEASQARMRLE